MRFSLLIASLLSATPALAQHTHPSPAAAPTWTVTPRLEARPAGRVEAVFIPRDMDHAEEIKIIPPKGGMQPAVVADGQARFRPQGGNYHLALADGEHDGTLVIAATAQYFANPGPAPSAILAARRPGLVLLPERLPREHASFRSGETVRFRLTADGQPLAGSTVQLETANGTHQRLVTDLDGMVAVTFPADFPPLDQRPPAVHGRPNGTAFVVSSRLYTSAQPRLASFSYTYGPDQLDGTSPWAGFGFAALGMAAAWPLVRHRRGGGK